MVETKKALIRWAKTQIKRVVQGTIMQKAIPQQTLELTQTTRTVQTIKQTQPAMQRAVQVAMQKVQTTTQTLKSDFC